MATAKSVTPTAAEKAAAQERIEKAKKADSKVGDGTAETAKAAAAREEADQASAVKLVQVLIMIVRDMNTKIPAWVYEYELPILYRVNGEDGIEEVGQKRTVEVVFLDADQQYGLLKDKYRANEQQMREVFPSARDLAKAMGIKYTSSPERRKKGEVAGGSLQVDHSVVGGTDQLTRVAAVRSTSSAEDYDVEDEAEEPDA